MRSVMSADLCLRDSQVCTQDRYSERITDEAGIIVREVDEPLSDHRGRGSAERAGSTD